MSGGDLVSLRSPGSKSEDWKLTVPVGPSFPLCHPLTRGALDRQQGEPKRKPAFQTCSWNELNCRPTSDLFLVPGRMRKFSGLKPSSERRTQQMVPQATAPSSHLWGEGGVWRYTTQGFLWAAWVLLPGNSGQTEIDRRERTGLQETWLHFCTSSLSHKLYPGLCS